MKRASHLLLVIFLVLGACDAKDSPPSAEPTAAEPTSAEPTSGPSAGAAGGHAHGGAGAAAALPSDFEGPGALALPDDLRALLVAEMVAIEAAMQRMLPALVRGELGTLASDAQAIHDSFILAQKLSPEQSRALGELLAPEFVVLDRQLHQGGADLARAAEAGDAERAAAIYGSMTAACVGCHRAYARERFPGLAAAAHSDDPAPPSAPAPEDHGGGHQH